MTDEDEMVGERELDWTPPPPKRKQPAIYKSKGRLFWFIFNAIPEANLESTLDSIFFPGVEPDFDEQDHWTFWNIKKD